MGRIRRAIQSFLPKRSGPIPTRSRRTVDETDNAPTRADARAIGEVKHTPVGRVGSFQDVAEAVAFLVRPEADYITGAILEVAGGWRI